MQEIWLSIPSYDGLYKISNTGKIKNKKNKILKTVIINGYHFIRLFKNKKYKQYSVSRLVLTVFDRPAKPREEAAHFPENNKNNNNINNLCWLTHKENEKHKIKHNTKLIGNKHGMSKLSENEILEIRKLKNKLTHLKISKKFNISRQHVTAIINNIYWKHI